MTPGAEEVYAEEVGGGGLQSRWWGKGCGGGNVRELGEGRNDGAGGGLGGGCELAGCGAGNEVMES